nr:hypothetical protein GPVRGNEL_GPVRGNEL_CDS_0027 [Caudoviricetes sp.]
MKKVFMFLAMNLCLAACGGEDEPTITDSGFSADITKILDVIDDHTWENTEYGQTTTISFLAFRNPESIASALNGVPMTFHGWMKRVYSGTLDDETEFYFILDPKAKTITGYGVGSDPKTYALNANCAYYYEIVDEKTIKLRENNKELTYNRK